MCELALPRTPTRTHTHPRPHPGLCVRHIPEKEPRRNPHQDDVQQSAVVVVPRGGSHQRAVDRPFPLPLRASSVSTPSFLFNLATSPPSRLLLPSCITCTHTHTHETRHSVSPQNQKRKREKREGEGAALQSTPHHHHHPYPPANTVFPTSTPLVPAHTHTHNHVCASTTGLVRFFFPSPLHSSTEAREAAPPSQSLRNVQGCPIRVLSSGAPPSRHRVGDPQVQRWESDVKRGVGAAEQLHTTRRQLR